MLSASLQITPVRYMSLTFWHVRRTAGEIQRRVNSSPSLNTPISLMFQPFDVVVSDRGRTDRVQNPPGLTDQGQNDLLCGPPSTRDNAHESEKSGSTCYSCSKHKLRNAMAIEGRLLCTQG